MRKKSILIGFCGFIAGIVFVIQCGNEAKSIAGKIASALDISFDNTGTTLTSLTVQDAIIELSSKIEGKKSLYVVDGDGNTLGLYGGSGIFNTDLQYFSNEYNLAMEISSIDGKLCSDLLEYTSLYFTENDCSGTKYTGMYYPIGRIFCSSDNLLYKATGNYLEHAEVKSAFVDDGINPKCQNLTNSLNINIMAIEQVEIQKTQYTPPIKVEAR